MVIIDMMDANDFITSTILDTESYKLRFSWNSEGFWTMDFRDSGGRDILRGIKVVANFPLLKQYRRLSNDLPHGELMAVVVNEDLPENQTLKRDSFSSGTFTFIYISEADTDAILAAQVSD